MKRLLVAVLLLGVSSAAAYAYFDGRRDRAYRRLVDQGEMALAAGDTYAAIEAFSGVVALRTDSMLGYLRRGEAYQRRRELDAARRDLLKASELDPAAPRPRELLGDVNAALLRHDRAAASYDAYLAIDDRSPQVLYKLALVRYRTGLPADSIAALQKALALDPRFVEARYLLGLCLRDEGRPAEAAAALARVVDLAPALLPPREALADLSVRLGRVDGQLAQLEALTALDPGPFRSAALGAAYHRAGMVDRAVFTLRQAAERHPTNADVRLALGRVWLETAETLAKNQSLPASRFPFAAGRCTPSLLEGRSGDTTGECVISADGAGGRAETVALGNAITLLGGVDSGETGSEGLTLLGRALLLAGEDERAERTLTEATTREPVALGAFLALAEAAERRAHPLVARQALLDHRLLSGRPREARADTASAVRIGDLSMQGHEAGTAATWYARALAGGGSDASLWARLATAQLEVGDLEAARRASARALERDPGNAAAQAVQRRLR